MNEVLKWTTLALMLSCTSARSAGLQALPTTYSATITDWPQGKTGTVQLEGTQAGGTVNAQGRFTLTLPTVATSKKLRQELSTMSTLFTDQVALNVPADQRCHGQGQATPATAVGNEFDLLASVAGGVPIRLALYTEAGRTTGLTDGSLLYFDTATTLDGTVTCKDFAIRYKGTFPAGWSLDAHPRSAIDPQTGFETEDITDALPDGATWHLYTAGAAVGLGLAPVTTGPAGLTVTGVTPGAPAARAGVQVNDVLVELNGASTVGLSVNQVRALLRGEPDTIVTLGILRGSNTTIRRLPVTRALVQRR